MLYPDQVLAEAKDTIASAGMVLFGFRHTCTIPVDLDARADDMTRACKVCDFLINGKRILASGPTTFADSLVFEAYEFFDKKLTDREKIRLTKLEDEAAAVREIFQRMMIMTPKLDDSQLEAAQKFCHELYVLLARGAR